MNINFESVDIYAFRSLNRVNVTLSDQGIVIVKGLNEYEDKATSNGSGKSSIFEAIIFAIFEETSSGEKDVENRILRDGYSIDLKFSIDNDKYRIFRQLKNNKSTVSLYKNDLDISARNKTDTNKLIQNILNINKNIFLDSIFLSQNATTNLASLSPTNRKERLEILTNTDELIETFKSNIKNKQLYYENLYNENNINISKLQGQKESFNTQIDDLDRKVKNIEAEIEKRKSMGSVKQIEESIINIDNNIAYIDNEIAKIDKMLEEVNLSINDLKNNNKDNIDKYNSIQKDILTQNNNINEIKNIISQKRNDISFYEKEIDRINKEIEKIKNSDTCPTCGRKYDNINEDHILKTITELKNNINDQNNKINSVNIDINQLNEECNKNIDLLNSYNEQLKDINSKIDIFNNSLEEFDISKNELINQKDSYYRQKQDDQLNKNTLINQKEELLKVDNNNLDEYKDLINSYKEKINNIDKDIEIETIKLQENNQYIDVTKNILQLIVKDFRTYLLKNSINYINENLKRYSQKLFSNEQDIIHIEENDTKLNIYLGTASYESLSGGEKTRVNIALLLAQKSLASIIGNVSCNLIILDEILGYCDAEAELNVIDLITSELDSLQSIYMISHKEIPIGYDKIITIMKDKSGLSNIVTS